MEEEEEEEVDRERVLGGLKKSARMLKISHFSQIIENLISHYLDANKQRLIPNSVRRHLTKTPN